MSPRQLRQEAKIKFRKRTFVLHGALPTLGIHGEGNLGLSTFEQKVKLLNAILITVDLRPLQQAQMPPSLTQGTSCSQRCSRRNYVGHCPIQHHKLTQSFVTKVSQQPFLTDGNSHPTMG